MDALPDLSSTEVCRLLAEREISPVELLDSCLLRIAAVNPTVNAVVALDEPGAREAAHKAETAIRRGEKLGPLHGIPVLIKDTQDTAGLRTTYGSPLFANHVPSADQGSVARLRAAGAIILGKTNTRHRRRTAQSGARSRTPPPARRGSRVRSRPARYRRPRSPPN